MLNYSFQIFDIRQRLLLKFAQYLVHQLNLTIRSISFVNLRAGNLLTLCATRFNNRAARV